MKRFFWFCFFPEKFYLTLFCSLFFLITLTAQALGQMVNSESSLALSGFSIGPLAERLQKSVVNISASRTIGGKEQAKNVKKTVFKKNLNNLQSSRPPFDEFFQNDQNDDDFEPVENTLGSGFVIDSKEGYILTNNHVVRDAEDIEIVFSDSKKLKAKIIGSDQKTDLALLKVDPNIFPLQEVEFADSKAAHIGDWVIAIGNPYGFGGSVTLGIISARNRDIKAGPYDSFIQTDAAINQGNSGGPLFDLSGKVLGVNTAIISPNGGSIGIGLAIPSELVIPVLQQLKEYGKVNRGWLALRIQSLTPLLAENLGLANSEGAVIMGKMSSADDKMLDNQALEILDVITEYNGQKVDNAHNLAKMISESEAGQNAKLVIWRKKKKLEVLVRLGTLKDSLKLPDNQQKASKQKGEGFNFLNQALLKAINPTLRKRYKIDKGVNGFVFSKIDPHSDLAKRGVQEGDSLVQLNQQIPQSFEEIEHILERSFQMGRQNVLLLIAKPDGTLSLIALLIQG